MIHHKEKQTRPGKKSVDHICFYIPKVASRYMYFQMAKLEITMHLMSLRTSGNGGLSLVANTYATKNSSIPKQLQKLLLPKLLILLMQWMIQKINPIFKITAHIRLNSKTKSLQYLQQLIDNLPENRNPFHVHALSSDDVKKAVKSIRNDCSTGHDILAV